MVETQARQLPETSVYSFFEAEDREEEVLEFRLIYSGKLPAASASTTRAREKQLIRKQFHPQLRALWNDHHALRRALSPKPEEEVPEIERIASNFERGPYRFVPLVTKDNGLVCALNVLFLRRDMPGGFVKSGGDIDNRLKVLLDALRMPENLNEAARMEPEDGETPFFCLLEDDALISELSITTDRLLLPAVGEEHLHDVVLVIHVVTKATKWHAVLRYF